MSETSRRAVRTDDAPEDRRELGRRPVFGQRVARPLHVHEDHLVGMLVQELHACVLHLRQVEDLIARAVVDVEVIGPAALAVDAANVEEPDAAIELLGDAEPLALRRASADPRARLVCARDAELVDARAALDAGHPVAAIHRRDRHAIVPSPGSPAVAFRAGDLAGSPRRRAASLISRSACPSPRQVKTQLTLTGGRCQADAGRRNRGSRRETPWRIFSHTFVARSYVDVLPTAGGCHG